MAKHGASRGRASWTLRTSSDPVGHRAEHGGAAFDTSAALNEGHPIGERDAVAWTQHGHEAGAADAWTATNDLHGAAGSVGAALPR